MKYRDKFMASAGTTAVDRPLKERFWVYRGKVLHHRKAAAEFDRLYWEIKGQQKKRNAGGSATK